MTLNFYEKVVLLVPNLSEEELQSCLKKISSVIEENGGEILKIENWGKKRLAYKLNKQRMGYYVLFLFKAPSSAIMNIENFYRVYDPVFKFMVVKLNKKQIEALPPELRGTPIKAEDLIT
ncbi:MAG: 30S ribosomal protein S6 [Thermodesulfovibrionaceae bacterium]